MNLNQTIKFIAVMVLVLASACNSAPVPQTSDLLALTLAAGVTLELVRVPAGPFLMGSADSDANAANGEKPQHTVILAEYLVGKYDVTNAQYAAFAKVTGRAFQVPTGKEKYPVVNVTWDEAVAFAKWASAVTGRQVSLPSEAEWEKAARGTDGRIYPWDDQWDAKKLNSSESGPGQTTPVGAYSPQGDSTYGAADMAGNVWQWTSSLYKSYPYRAGDGREDPSSRDERVLRGGSWYVRQELTRCSFRDADSPDDHSPNIGFRVVVRLANGS